MKSKRKAVYFVGKEKIEIREEPVPQPRHDTVTVQTEFSAISAGTELLLYNQQLPTTIACDETISSLPATFEYPLKYGYSAVGQIIDTGTAVDPQWRGKRVFSLHPHESTFIATLDELTVIPDRVTTADALFFPNMETAVTLVIDGDPAIGQQIAIFGQGVVGLLTTALLTRFPGTRVITFDRYEKRRDMSLQLGAGASIDPAVPDAIEKARSHIDAFTPDGGTDLTIEVSGNPRALQQAINMTGFGGTVVIGSWYGTKPVTLDLGTAFHRNRITLKSSQVSTVAPSACTCWSKNRRASVAWHMLDVVQPAQHLISHRFAVEDAPQAYAQLNKQPETALQVILTY